MTPITLNRRSTCKGTVPAKKPPVGPTIINNTEFSLEQVRNFPRYGGFINYWRQRYVDVYQPPVNYIEKNPGYVITVGTNHESNTIWICEEPYEAYESRIINADWSAYR